MTTSINTPRLAYTADGSTVSFTFNFEIADNTSIAVYEGSTKKTLTTHYTVSFDSGTAGTGSVVFVSAPSAATTITFVRDTNLTRTTDFAESGAFLASTVNAELDRLSQAVIDSTNKIETSAVLLGEPHTETPTLTIPNVATRSSKALAFDGSGNITVSSVGTGTLTSVVAGTGLSGGTITTTGTVAVDFTGVTAITSGLGSTDELVLNDSGTLKRMDVSVLTGYNAGLSETLTNKTLTSPVLNTGVSGTAILDEDAMGTDSATQLATQQSIKAYVDSKTHISLSGSTNNTVATVTGANALAGETNLQFDGSTLAVTGAATVSTTLGVTGASTLDGVTVTDNTVSTNASNADLELTANGSGKVSISGLKYPSSDGTTNYVLKTDGSGTLSWTENTGESTGDLTFVGSTITAPSNADFTLALSGTGNIVLDALTIHDNSIGTNQTNADLILDPAGTGNVNLSGAQIQNVEKIVTDNTSAPAADAQLANKKYVDDSVVAGIVSTVTNISQGNSNITVADSGTGTITTTVDGNTEMTVTDAGIVMYGNLEVKGTTTTLNTTNTSIEDPILELSRNNSGPSDIDAGIMINRGASNNAAIYWNEGDDKFKAVTTTSAASATAVTDTAFADFQVKDLSANSLTISTDLTVANGGTGASTFTANQLLLGNGTSPIAVSGALNWNAGTSTLEVTGSLSTTANIENDAIRIVDHTILGLRSNDNIVIDPAGTGSVAIDKVAITGGTITGITDITVADGGTGASSLTDNSVLTGTGTSPITAEGNLTFSGSTLAVTGNITATTTIAATTAITAGTTLGVTGASTLDGVTITDNTISTNASNSDFIISANGSGIVHVNDSLKIGTGATVTTILDEDAMGTDSATALATQQSVKAYVDSKSHLSLIDEDNMATDSATRPPSQQSVKAYVDGQTHSGAVLSGSTNNTVATVTGANALVGEANLQFDGSTLAVTGNITATTTIAATTAITAGTSIANDAISIDDNVIQTTRSNDDLRLAGNGTGVINISPTNVDYTAYSSDTRWANGTNIVHKETGIDPNTMSSSAKRRYSNNRISKYELNGTDSAQGNSRFRQTDILQLDLNSSNLTATGVWRGPVANYVSTEVFNTSADNVTCSNVNGVQVEPYIFGSADEGDITITTLRGITVDPYIYSGANQTITFTNCYGFIYEGSFTEGAGTEVITNDYAFYVDKPTWGQVSTNKWGFYDADPAGQSLFGDIKIKGNTISTNSSNADLEIDTSGTGKIVTSAAVYGIGDGSGGNIVLTDQADGDFQTSSGASIGMLDPTGLQVDAAGSYHYPQVILNAFSTNSYPVIWATRSNSATHGTNAYLDAGDVIFQFYGAGWNGDTDGTGYWSANASCDFYASEAHSISQRGGGIILKTLNKGTVSSGTAKITIEDHVMVDEKLEFKKNYQENIDALTSSGTITVNCSAASVFTVTLDVNTEFNITNLGTGQSVTIIITQDGGGTNTASWGTSGSTAVKFPGGAPTLSTAGAAIDVVTIFNDGTNYIGNMAKAYAA